MKLLGKETSTTAGCMDINKRLASVHIDCVLTSPYGIPVSTVEVTAMTKLISPQGNRGEKQSRSSWRWRYQLWCEKRTEQHIRKVQVRGSAILDSQSCFAPTWAEIIPEARKGG